MNPDWTLYGLLALAVAGVGMLVSGFAVRARQRPPMPDGSPPLSAVLIGLGALFAPMGAVMAWFLPAALRDHDDMLRAGQRFVEIVRTGDVAAVRAAAAPGAVLDERFLEVQVRPSQGVSFVASASSSDDGCALGAIVPSRSEFYLFIVHEGGRWQVKRAGPHDEECDDRVDD